MSYAKSSFFENAAAKIPIKVLNIVIIAGIAAMALLIPFLSARGGFTVSFDSMGGTSVASQRVRYGESIAEPEAPTRENYVFDGWFYDNEGKRRFDFNTEQADKNITLYAVWKEE